MNKILIVGRPNVGKSSLFNRLAKKKQALVVNQPGVTRDILKQKCSWWGGEFEVWDSGGLWAKESRWSKLIDSQVSLAMSQVDLVLFVMSALSYFQDEDKKIFQLIKKSGRPFLALVNKVDEVNKAPLLLSDFYRLGVKVFPCSFEQGHGVPEIVEWIISHKHSSSSRGQRQALSLNKKDLVGDKVIRLLLAGQTNVGKSTLSNALLRQNRSLVSPHPGTTLDVVEEQFSYGSHVYSLCDTAGFMKAGKTKLESLSTLKTTQMFKTADIVLLLLDKAKPDRLSARILSVCATAHKPVIVVVNKWDALCASLGEGAGQAKEKYRKNIQTKWAFYSDLLVVFVSALKEEGLGTLMKKVEEVYQKSCFRVSTSELNRFFTQVIRKTPSPVYGTRNVKFYYLTQTKQVPPTFIAFANYPEGVKSAYKRFVIKQIQKKWNLKGVPVRLSILPRHK